MTSETWTVTGPQIIDVENITAVDATIMTGRVDIVAHDDPARTDARVEVHSVEGHPLEVRLEGERLVVGYELSGTGWKWFADKFRLYTGKDKADVHIAVPASAYAKLSTVRGEGLVAGTRSGARVGTVSGSVMTTHTRGVLRVDSVSGEVIASDHEGDVLAETVSGDVTLTGPLGEIRVETVSGALTADSVTTPQSVTVSSVSADVLVRVPDPQALDCVIRCVSGRLLVDGAEYKSTNGSFTRSHDAQHGDGAQLRVTTVSGNVTVLRADDADYGSPRPSAAATVDGGSVADAPSVADSPVSDAPADSPTPDAPAADAPVDASAGATGAPAGAAANEEDR